LPKSPFLSPAFRPVLQLSNRGRSFVHVTAPSNENAEAKYGNGTRITQRRRIFTDQQSENHCPIRVNPLAPFRLCSLACGSVPRRSMFSRSPRCGYRRAQFAFCILHFAIRISFSNQKGETYDHFSHN